MEAKWKQKRKQDRRKAQWIWKESKLSRKRKRSGGEK